MEDLIKKDNIDINVSAIDWKDAVRKAGNILVDSGDIKEEYIDNMIKAVQDLGPYMVLTKGFALAHAAPCEAINNTAISLISLREPVNFGSNNDPVKIVMCLACKDNSSHMEYIQKVATILMQEGTMDKLMNSTTIDELYLVINGMKEE